MANILQKIKSGVINATANVISAPAQYRAYRQINQANADVKALKADRAIKGKPIEPYDESNPDFRTRMNAIGVRFRRGAMPMPKPPMAK